MNSYRQVSMKFLCWRRKLNKRKIHPLPLQHELENLIFEHHTFLYSCLFGKYTFITGEMIHTITQRSARFTALLNTASLHSENMFIEDYEKKFAYIEKRIYDELRRMFKEGNIRFAADALRLIFLQKRVGVDKTQRSGSALF
jgi:hypothetical protein